MYVFTCIYYKQRKHNKNGHATELWKRKNVLGIGFFKHTLHSSLMWQDLRHCSTMIVLVLCALMCQSGTASWQTAYMFLSVTKN